MESRTFLGRYRLCVDRFGIPVVLRQNAHEDTLKAIDLESNGLVAVQIEPAADFGETEREQLENEARAACQIDHVNVPRLRDFGFDDDQLVYVTDYLEGVTADEWIRRNGAMTPRAVLQIGSQAVSALVAASLHGIIHHAVHPGNIMLLHGGSADGEWPRINVLNFLGVAPELSPAMRNGSNALNPANFASPEQIQDGPVTFRSEIYSLGCTLWFLLKAQAPSAGAAGVHDATDMPAPVRLLISRMLAEDPADRPSDPGALQQQIRDCLEQLERPKAPLEVAEIVQPTEAAALTSGLAGAVAPALATWIEPLPRRHRSSSRWPLALAALLLGLGTLAAVIFAQRSRPVAAIATAPSDINVASKTATPNPLPIQNSVEPAAAISANEPSPSEVVTPDLVATNMNAFEGATLIAETNSFDLADSAVPETPLAPAPTTEQQRTEEPLVALELTTPAPAREIRLAQVALDQPRTVAETASPGEGPIDSVQPLAEDDVTADEPAQPPAAMPPQPEAPVTPPQKPSAIHYASKPAEKKSRVAKTSPKPIARSLARQHYAPSTVGHILFPASVDNSAATSDRKSRQRKQSKQSATKNIGSTPRLASDS